MYRSTSEAPVRPPQAVPSTSEAVIITDALRNVVFWSHAAEKVFGYASEEVLGWPLNTLFDSDLRRGRRRDGSTFDADVSFETWDTAGVPFYSVTIRERVTEDPVDPPWRDLLFEAARLLLRESRFSKAAPPLLKLLAEELGWDAGAIWLPGPERRLSCRAFWGADDSFSAFAEASSLMSLPAGIGMPGRVWSTGAPEWNTEIEREIHFFRTDAAHESGVQSTVAFPLLNGRECVGVIEFFSRARRKPNRAMLELMFHVGVQVAMFLERERAQIALARAEDENRRMAASFSEAQRMAHVGTFEHDIDGDTIRWSDELYRLHGLEPQSRRIDSDFTMSRVPDEEKERIQFAFSEALRTREPLDLTTRIVRLDGGERMFRIRAWVVTEPRLRFVGSVLDVTADEIAERKRVELERQLEEARRLSALGGLAATMAHEFNNVLMGISSFTEYLRRHATTGTMETAIGQIQLSVQRGRSITDDILRFTRSAEPVLVSIDVGSWLQNFHPEAQALTNGRTQLSVQGRMMIHGDVAQLNQALVNLVLNARDASPADAPIAITAKATNAELMPGCSAECLDLSVTDRGSGIAPEVRERIFEPLFTTKHRGNGLGLAVVQRVVRAHGGTIVVDTEVQRGTSFHLLLPATHGGGGLLEAPAERTLPSTVLLVDDEESVALGLCELLKSEGIDARVVDRGHKVLPALEESMPEAMVIDVGLPDISATDLYPMIAERHPDLPVIFISGHAQPTELDHHRANPRIGFLRKPFELDELLAELATVTAR